MPRRKSDPGRNAPQAEETVRVELSRPSLYVGIGASAGGLEAIEAFFGNMPPESGMAFVVVQHLSPDYKSLMVELLSKRTRMPVRRAEDGVVVEANTVYLIPPKRDLTIFHGKLLLHDPDPGKTLHLPIDVFFRSLAEDQGERAVGVVLSGTGSDGTRGVRFLKEAGGAVIVQSDDSARFDGMPRSAIATGLADFVLPPEEMPRQLLALAGSPRLVGAEPRGLKIPGAAGLDRVFALLRERTKVDFTHYKPSTVLRRIERRMTVNQTPDLDAFVRLLENSPREVTALYRELLIGVTSFFRDPEAYELLQERWLPDLLGQAEGREARFWMPGCSTGEEAYSLAIACAEWMERTGRTVPIKIFATDLDADAIAKASAGVYPATIAADLPPGCFAKYFTLRQEEVQVVRRLREWVVFAQHNVVKDPPFTNIDLVSCRNLLIYLQPVLQRKVLGFFNFSLNPGGVLFLGSSETTGDLADCFDTLSSKWKIYRARGKRTGPVLLGEIALPPAPGSRLPRTAASGAGRTLRQHEEERLLERLLQKLAGEYVPPAVVVNEQMEILHVVGDVSRYFRVPAGRVQVDVGKMAVKELVIPLTAGLQRVLQKREDVRYTNVRVGSDETAVTLQVSIRPLVEKKGQEPLAVVLFEERPGRTGAEAARGSEFDLGKESEARIGDLEQELQFTKENLQATIEELETSNEELQATNEELLASNEELQSTNEELQSVNEELHTVNAEHQVKIFELTELTNDLDNLLAGTELAVLFLDEDLAVRKFTPQAGRYFRIADADVGRSLETLPHRFRGVAPLEVARQVQRSLSRWEGEAETLDGTTALLRALPYRVGPGAVSGVLLTAVDVTLLREAQSSLARREEQLAEVAEVARVARWEYVPVTGALVWPRDLLAADGVPAPATWGEVLTLVAEPARPALKRAVRATLEQGQPLDESVPLGDGSGASRWLRFLGHRVVSPDGGARLVGALQDVTRLARAEQALLESRVEYRSLFEALASAVLVLEPSSSGFLVVTANDAAARLCGLRAGAAVRVPLEEALPGAAASGLTEILAHVLSSGKTARFPVVRYRDASRDFWMELSSYRLENGNVVLLFDDVSERIGRAGEVRP